MSLPTLPRENSWDLIAREGPDFVHAFKMMDFLRQSIASAARAGYTRRVSSFWEGQRRQTTLALFRKLAKSLPAYRRFLRARGIDPKVIKNFRDLEKLPSTSKDNYFQKYPLDLLTWQGGFGRDSLVFTSTSGSTGQPTYFLRNHDIDWQYSVLAEDFLSRGRSGATLLIDCFGMGVWIGGLITYQAFRFAGLRGFSVSIITPGINKQEIFHALSELAPRFESVILAGYPPFLKDILEEAASNQVSLRHLRLRLLFAAEGFSELFRENLCKLAGIRDLYRDTLNIYGSAEAGAMAFETPTSIFLRRLATRRRDFFRALFGQNEKLPTLAQYNPQFINFDSPEGLILISADSGTPLFRYRIGDRGGVIPFSQVVEIGRALKLDLEGLLKRARLPVIRLPFVYVFERDDFSTKLYGSLIFPEHIRQALQTPRLAKHFTGKFTMQTKLDGRQNQYLELNLELRPRQRFSAGLRKLCGKQVVKSLLAHNAEYRNNYTQIPARVTPKIVAWTYEHPRYFKPGVKQRWVR